MNGFIIGVQKSATTSLGILFNNNDHIDFDISLKDVHFLSKNYKKENKKDLRNKFYKKVNKNNSLYIAVNYWRDELVIEELIKLNFKLIIILRNPVDRAISAHRYFSKLGQTNKTLKRICKDYIDNGVDELDIISNSMYSKILKQYSEPTKKKLLVLKYEDLILKEEKFLEKIEFFFNLKLINRNLKKSNISGKENTYLKNIYKSIFYKCLSVILKKILPKKLIKLIYFKKRDLFLKNPNLIDIDSKKYLNKIFEQEIMYYDSNFN
ncbi:sulfotransferase domain-containing protein [Flavobacteriaceae bacterium]|nr:sulfotransferase domain-containing protein [Flavobacteriaceae bacterium]